MFAARKMMLGGGGGGGATLTAGYHALFDGNGYVSPTIAASLGISAVGSISGAATPFGTVHVLLGMSRNLLALSSPVGTPTSLTVAGVGTVGLIYDSTTVGYDFYFLDADLPIANGNTYAWSLS